MTIGRALKDAEAQLQAAGIASAKLDALILLECICGVDRSRLLAHPELLLAEEKLERYARLIQKRARRIPVSQILGKKEFYNLEFEITPDVLTPRPESEQIVDHALKYAPRHGRILDMGTGCGAIAIAIAKNRLDLEVFASDISPAALAVAKRNATKHKLNINFTQSDLFSAISGQFDSVVANLPYLPDQDELLPETSQEPAVALRGGPDGLEIYRRFFNKLPDHLAPGGCTFIESDPWQHEAIIGLAGAVQMKPVEQGYFVLGLSAREL